MAATHPAQQRRDGPPRAFGHPKALGKARGDNPTDGELLVRPAPIRADDSFRFVLPKPTDDAKRIGRTACCMHRTITLDPTRCHTHEVSRWTVHQSDLRKDAKVRNGRRRTPQTRPPRLARTHVPSPSGKQFFLVDTYLFRIRRPNTEWRTPQRISISTRLPRCGLPYPLRTRLYRPLGC